MMTTAAAEELEALTSIYGEEAIVEQRKDYYEIELVCASSTKVRLQVSLSEQYPEEALPQFGVATVYGLSESMRLKVLEAVIAAVQNIREEICVFQAVTAAYECLEKLLSESNEQSQEEEKKNNEASWTFCPAHPQYGQRLRRFDAASVDPEYAVDIKVGEPIIERKSTFQAFLAKDLNCIGQVNWVLRDLLSRPKLAKATHAIWAYRLVDKENILRADYDDDGEDGAAVKMAHILDLFDTNGSLVMVSRWFGGIKLGPDRFKIIAKLTQAILQDNGIQRHRNNSYVTNHKKVNISSSSVEASNISSGKKTK